MKCRIRIISQSLYCLTVAILAGCGTIGIRPLSALKEGSIYQDSQNRFSVVVPDNRNLVAHRTPEGVQFVGEVLHRGDLTYAVFVYPIPMHISKDAKALDAVINGLEVEMSNINANMEITKKEYGQYKGWPSVDLYYHVTSPRSYRLYVSRMVQIDANIYNMYYSIGDAFKSKPTPEEAIDKYHLPKANKLFDGVQIKQIHNDNEDIEHVPPGDASKTPRS